ncbi:MAG: efflux RND transporter periplasmic adaptor subunit [candidate division KSB1 bacterium]|nr:efflux RND transporter periplasmic adaptor subunit [candidate division KSB1 bacterium]
MKKSVLWSILGMLLLAAAGATLNSCGDETGASDLESFSIGDQQEKPTNVEVQVVKPSDFVEYIEVPGTVEADIATTISAEEAGKVVRIGFKKGEQVKQGDVLIELDSEVLRKTYDEARAAFESARIRYERQKNLFEQNAISEQQYLDSKYAFERAEAAMQALKARLDKIAIRSPIAGILDNRYVDLGEFVSPGMRVAEVIKIDFVRVVAGVPERYITDIRMDSPVITSIDILGDRTFPGKITFIGSTINPQSRTFPVEVRIRNRDGLIKPNMLARLHIVRETYTNGIVVPRDVLIETEIGKQVFVAENGLAKAKKVEIVASSSNQVLIRGEVQFGDRLIVRGHRELVDGERIAVQNENSAQ